ncbi:23S rRNA (guanosine(2251)-2'-O)-methyltransferase RlmB [Thermomicrobium roseum]|jgi:23S rRNA (guanosine2251-2'-O)-methyltransferase|uniref:RNA methyltransferase, TrmH family, group 3 n=2 Tax=Thermomicrobium TaxID=499 RepID=B9KYY7_THERP|nr:23S rRNA (guanosine(2251)-2'-O)-methyltransferase RlmB [Thermomicrobium roseum]ACM05432.1 RNA methyltransferase, TrmH family, group 3 [Thermomicrobium roseum DSM 5159]MBO9386365.1 23S rRNA (guanosine(2251)-2'-O)-methyltransferase RlmB [Thermomicrobium sp.]
MRRLQPGRPSEYLYGRNAVAEALRGRRRHRRLFVASGIETHGRIVALMEAARVRGIPVIVIPRSELDRMVGSVNHQGVVLETSPYPYVDFATLLDPAPESIVLLLDHLQDPQNIATLLRTAEAAGVRGVVLPERRAAGITPAVVNASAGAVEHLQITLVTNLARAVDTLREHGYWIVALEPGPNAQSLFRAPLPLPLVLLVGAEGHGLSPVLLKRADVQVIIPMLGQIESLNAAVAGSIALYEIVRRLLGQESAEKTETRG